MQFDYYKENERDFYNKFTADSVLIQGKHKTSTPMVTIILTTYKRPGLLKYALESALNQVDFDDYQIIVADNEGEDINEETDTAKLISNYKSDKILYYRHKETINFKVDYAVRFARSKWICFMHDDDILASNHLAVMSSIIEKHKNIKYLSCILKPFDKDLKENEFHLMTKAADVPYLVKKYPKAYVCLGYFPGWLGAFIDREAYISTGGMPTISNNLGDYCMVGKFIYRYGVYELVSNTPLYFYRIWSGQASSGGSEVWKRLYIAEYEYHTYVTRIYHKYFRGCWNRISAYRILGKCDVMNRSSYHTRIDLEQFASDCGMSADILYKGKQYRKDLMLQTLYESLVDHIFKPVKYEGEVKADI